jgi:hypothetical protein
VDYCDWTREHCNVTRMSRAASGMITLAAVLVQATAPVKLPMPEPVIPTFTSEGDIKSADRRLELRMLSWRYSR